MVFGLSSSMVVFRPKVLHTVHIVEVVLIVTVIAITIARIAIMGRITSRADTMSIGMVSPLNASSSKGSQTSRLLTRESAGCQITCLYRISVSDSARQLTEAMG